MEQYAPQVVSIRDAVAGRTNMVLERLRSELDRLSSAERFEDAAAHRDRLAALVRSLDRSHRLCALARIPELVAARPDGQGGWHVAVIRHARLAAAGSTRRGEHPMPVIDSLQAAAETVVPGEGPLHGASPEEARVLYRWLTTGGTRMVRCSQPWTEPAGSAGAWRRWVDKATAARTPYPAPD